MPANVVKPGQEADWERAKKRAAEEGHAEDWAYVNAIFQKMTKSFAAPAPGQLTTRSFTHTRDPGQVPDRERIEAMKLATTRAPRFSAHMMLTQDSPMMSTGSVVDGLGFEPGERMVWKSFLDEVMQQPNEVVMRKQLLSKMFGDRLDPALRRALFQRSVNLYRNMQKSLTIIIDPNELSKALPPEFKITPEEFEAVLGPAEPYVQFHLSSKAAMDNRIANLCARKGISREEFDRRAKQHQRNRETTLSKASASAATPIGGITPSGNYRRVGKDEYKRIGNVVHLKPRSDSTVRTGEFFNPGAKAAAIEFLTKKAIEHAAAQTLEALPEGHQLTTRYGKKLTKVTLAGGTVWTDKKSQWLTSEEVWRQVGRGVLDREAPGWHPDLNTIASQVSQVVSASIQKSEIVLDLDEVLRKADAHGGSYYRRTTTKSGKHRYFYSPEEYERSKDAHVDGSEQAHKRITEHVSNGVKESGKKGYHVKELKSLVKRYGSKRVGESLKKECANGGGLKYKGGRFYASEQPKEKKQ